MPTPKKKFHEKTEAEQEREIEQLQKLAKIQKFILRNFVVMHMAEIINYRNGNTMLGYVAGIGKDHVELCKRALAEAGAIKFVGKSRIHTDKYEISLERLTVFVDMVKLYADAPPMPKWMEGFEPDPEGDEREELEMYAAEDLLAGDQSTEDRQHDRLADETEREYD